MTKNKESARKLKRLIELSSGPIVVKLRKGEPKTSSNLKKGRFCHLRIEARHRNTQTITDLHISCPVPSRALGFKSLPKKR